MSVTKKMSSTTESHENKSIEKFENSSASDEHQESAEPVSAVATEAEKLAQIEEIAQSLNINQSKLMWKCDTFTILPFALLYFLAFLDRINISNAKVYGMETDLGLVGNQFNTALTVFFVPYVFFEILSNYCMKLVKPHVWLSSCIFFFGIITLGMGFVKNFGGLVACRFLLGVFESGSFPAIFYVLANYYTRAEAQRRFSLFFSTVCLAGACGGAIAYKIGVDLDGAHGYSSWRYIFIIEGTFTAGLSVLLWFTIADFPEEARFLNNNERSFLKQKLAIMSNTESGYEHSYNFKDIIQILKSPNIWIPTLGYGSLVIGAYGYAYFATSIIKEMGYTGMEANRYSIYPWLIAFAFSNALGFLSDHLRMRLPFALISCVVAIIGLAMILGMGDGNIHVRYAGCFLSVTGLYTAMPLLVCWASLNLGGHARKGVGSGTMIGVGNIGGIISTWIFLSKDAPLYKPGLAICIAFCCLAIASISVYFVWCHYMNKRKQSTAYTEAFYKQETAQQIKDGDLHPNFVYGY